MIIDTGIAQKIAGKTIIISGAANPHITQKIAKTGTVNYDYGYDARIYGTLIDANNSYGINAIQVDPNSLSITEDELTNVVKDTTISYTVDVNWGI